MAKSDKKYMREYYPNGRIKHEICYYTNGGKYLELFYDEDGQDHREDNLPDYQSWDENGRLNHKTYCCHGKYHNICNPADICFFQNRKIWWKIYNFNNIMKSKLLWQKLIKNI